MTITRYNRRSPFHSPWLEGENRRYHLWERRHGSFKRTFGLPRTVKTEKITASVKDGVLFIQVPKAPEAKSRKVPIKSEN